MTTRTLIAILCLASGSALVACDDDASTGDASTAPDMAVPPDLVAVPDLGKPAMSFFVTSRTGSANLGGLAGADAICTQLATAAGVTGKKWAAYLSADAMGMQAAVNAKDRIGAGPWYNASGVKIADNLTDLHDKTKVNINKQTALDETGKIVPGRGDMPNEHDILTGTKADGTLSPGATCNNWTSEATMNANAIVGHHDRMGLDMSDPAMSWNSSHASRACDAMSLRMTGGAGRFYCFAVQ